MSYGSTFLQFEANGRISQKFSRTNGRKEHPVSDRPHHKTVHYEKEFDVSLTRVDASSHDRSGVRDSMLAYSKKMRSIQDSRFLNNGKQDDSLFVRAKHIPKFPTKTPKKRRPMSFDELLGRDREEPRERPGAARARPSSEKIPKDRGDSKQVHLPSLSSRVSKTSPNVQLSLVSASDLYDIVDISLRSKGTRNDSLKMLQIDKQVSRYASPRKLPFVVPDGEYSKFQRTSDTSKQVEERKQYAKIIEEHTESDDEHIPSEEFYQNIFALDKNDPQPLKPNHMPIKLPTLAFNNDPIKRRPQRAKRMRLVDPGLDDIPEDNVIQTNNTYFDVKRGQQRLRSPPPSHKPLEKICESVPSLASIDETDVTSNSVDNATRRGIERLRFRDVENSESTDDHSTMKDSEPDTPRMAFPPMYDVNSNKMVIRDDGDVRIEVTQCPPKTENNLVATKLKAQKRFRKMIFLRDGPK